MTLFPPICRNELELQSREKRETNGERSGFVLTLPPPSLTPRDKRIKQLLLCHLLGGCFPGFISHVLMPCFAVCWRTDGGRHAGRACHAEQNTLLELVPHPGSWVLREVVVKFRKPRCNRRWRWDVLFPLVTSAVRGWTG